MMASAYSAMAHQDTPMVMARPAMGPEASTPEVPLKLRPVQPCCASSSGGTAATKAYSTNTKITAAAPMVPTTAMGMLRPGLLVSPASWMAWVKPNSEKNTPAVEMAMNMLVTSPLAWAGTDRFSG